MCMRRPEGARVALMRVHDDVSADRIGDLGKKRGAVDRLLPRFNLVKRDRPAGKSVTAAHVAAVGPQALVEIGDGHVAGLALQSRPQVDPRREIDFGQLSKSAQRLRLKH